MKAKWLFEPDVFEDNTDKLIEIVKKQGMDAKVIPYVPFDDVLVDRCTRMYSDNDCVIFYGSLNFGKKLKKASWVPGVYLDEEAFKCTAYYPPLSDLLLHYNDFIMLPYGSLVDKRDQLFEHFKTPELFIRPDSGTKEFTGFVTTLDQYNDAIELAGFYDVEPDLLVLVSGAKNLKKEWRFVIVNGEVVSGSLYRDWDGTSDDYSSQDYVLSHSKSVWEEGYDQRAWELAKICARRYNPGAAWTIDIASVEGGTYHVLEIGCFSCAGLYGNDLEKVVEAVSNAALTEWKEIYE